MLEKDPLSLSLFFFFFFGFHEISLHFKDIIRFTILRDREGECKFSLKSFGIYMCIINLRVINVKIFFS